MCVDSYLCVCCLLTCLLVFINSLLTLCVRCYSFLTIIKCLIDGRLNSREVHDVDDMNKSAFSSRKTDSTSHSISVPRSNHFDVRDSKIDVSQTSEHDNDNPTGSKAPPLADDDAAVSLFLCTDALIKRYSLHAFHFSHGMKLAWVKIRSFWHFSD